MAITITQEADKLGVGTEFCFSDQQIVYMASSTNIAQPKFKYIVQVFMGATEVFKTYIPKNPSDRMRFDLRTIVNHFNGIDVEEYNTPTTDILTVPNSLNQIFTKSDNACKEYELRIGELCEVAGVLIEHLALTNTKVYVFTGRMTINFGQIKIASAYIANTSNQGWMIEAYRKPFINWRDPLARGLAAEGKLLVRVCDEEDFGVISFIHDDGALFNTCDSFKVRYEIFDDAGVQLGATQDFPIDAASGAAAPTSATDNDKLIHFGAYPANLNLPNHSATQKPNAAAWGYYTMQIVNSLAATVGEKVYFVQNTECYKSKKRIAWWSDVSGWEFFNFYASNETTITNKKKNYKQLMGDYSGTANNLYTHTRESVSYHSDNVNMVEVESGWMDEYTYQFLSSILHSKEVRMIQNETLFVPVILKTNSFKIPDQNRNGLKSVKFKFEIAQPC